MLALRDEVSKTIRSSRKIKEVARKVAEQKVELAKAEMIQEFETHPVTQEIKEGPNSEDNKSGTLGGYGNLYTFIGFEEGQQPTEVIKDYLEKKTELQRNVRYIRGGEEGSYQFKVSMPIIAEVEELTPSPWEGKSWVRGMERGISGLGYYIFSKIRELKNSRSGNAVQAGSKVRDLTFKPVKYLSTIISNFRNKIR